MIRKLVAAVVLGLFALGTLGGVGAAAPVTLTIAQGVDLVSTNPLDIQGVPMRRIMQNMFDQLIVRDDNMEYQPALATSWEPISDLEWRIRIREGVVFHNGDPLTAEDVAFSLEWVMDAANGSANRHYFAAFDKVTVVDPYTVIITTKYPYPLVPYQLAMAMVVPKDYFLEVGVRGFEAAPVGAGPYKFSRWIRDDRVELEAFADYWGGQPSIDRVVWRAIPEQATRVAELRTGRVDIVTDLSPSLVPSIENARGVRVASTPSTRQVHIFMNTLEFEPFQSEKVRQAMNYAVDRASIVEHVLQGFGTQISIPMAPQGFGYDPDLHPYPYDPEKAKQLLAEAGYPNGFSVKMSTPDGRYLMDRQVAQAVAAYLGQVGIQVDLSVYEWGRYATMLAERSMPDLFLMGWAELDPGAIWGQLLGPNGAYSYYRDAEMDAQFEKASGILDADERLVELHKLVHMTHERAPLLFMHAQHDIYGVSESVEWNPRPDEYIYAFRIRKAAD